MKKVSVILAMAVALVLATVAAPVADASCIPAKTASNVSRPSYADSRYFSFTGDAGNAVGTANPQINSAFWQTDNPAGANQGTFGDWVSGAFGSNYWYFRANLGGAGVVGCPTGCITVYVENEATNQFILWTREEAVGPPGAFDNDFDFTSVDGGGFGTTAPGISPRPRVSGSSRAGTDINLTVDVDDVSAGVRTGSCGGAVTNIQLFSLQSANRPSTSPDGWVAQGTFAGTAVNGAGVTVDCTVETQNQWVAAGLSVDGAPVQILSQPVAVECDPNIADPPDVQINTKPRPGREGKSKKSK